MYTSRHVSGTLRDLTGLYWRGLGLLYHHLLTQVCRLFAAVTLREDSAKRLERRARRVSACLSDYSLASDSGVFEPLTKRLGADPPFIICFYFYLYYYMFIVGCWY